MATSTAVSCHSRPLSPSPDSTVISIDYHNYSTHSPPASPHLPLPHCFNSIDIPTPAANASSSSSNAAHEPSLEEGQGESSCDHLSDHRSLMCRVLIDHNVQDMIASRSMAGGRTGSIFYNDIEQEQEYFQQVLGSSSQGWTDEKHSYYLDSMEAQFLNCVLFNNRMCTYHQNGGETSSELCDSASSSQAKSSNEFKVCQNGKWKSVKVGALTHLAVAVRNPWIKRFRQSPPKPKFNPSSTLEHFLQVPEDCGGR